MSRVLWYSIPDAAKAARVPERTLRRAVAEGQISARRVSKRRVYVWWTDVEKWRHERLADPG